MALCEVVEFEKPLFTIRDEDDRCKLMPHLPLLPLHKTLCWLSGRLIDLVFSKLKIKNMQVIKKEKQIKEV
jgi:hypothetical protein